MAKDLFKKTIRNAGLFGAGIALLANTGCSPNVYNAGNETYSLQGTEMKEMTGRDTITYNVSDWGTKTLREVSVNGKGVSDENVPEYRGKFIEGLRDIDSLERKEFVEEHKKEGYNSDSLKNYYDSRRSFFR